MYLRSLLFLLLFFSDFQVCCEGRLRRLDPYSGCQATELWGKSDVISNVRVYRCNKALDPKQLPGTIDRCVTLCSCRMHIEAGALGERRGCDELLLAKSSE
jgi:hypothetical protein